MIKFYKIIICVAFSLIISSCNQSINQNNQNKNSLKYNPNLDKTIVRTFFIEWKLVNGILTKLPKDKKEEAKIKCDGKKLVLIKIDTNKENLAKGEFKCID